MTIYSTYENKAPESGVVEIINLYGNNYFSIALDGEVLREVQKESYEAAVLKRSFIKECVKRSKVKENKLKFVYIDWENFCEENGIEYDANDYEEYDSFQQVISNHNAPFKWQRGYQFVKVLAIGIEDLENNI